MRKSKFTEEQIIGFLKQAEAGMAVVEICRKGGVLGRDVLQMARQVSSDSRNRLPGDMQK